MEGYEAFVVLYVVAILVTAFLAAKGKTSWFSLVGVIIMPVYFMWVLVDALSSTKEKESQEEQPQSELVE
ncbi:MAG: hypothetical protein KAW46_12155 [candidate division Zixibacteria bacterium]|nr:hypothetical protein [candidate division Zixibacteria bacterium]